MAKKPRKHAKKPLKIVQETPRRGRGRPSAFKPVYNEEASRLCKLGATDDALALWFGVEQRTIDNWKQKYPDFFQSLKRGKLEHDTHVAVKLFNRAEGAVVNKQKEVKLKKTHFDPETGKKLLEEEKVVIVDLKEELPPDTTAMIFWLINRQKDIWRNRKELTGADGKPLVPNGPAPVSSSQIEGLIALGEQLTLVETLAEGAILGSDHAFGESATGAEPGTVPAMDGDDAGAAGIPESADSTGAPEKGQPEPE